jgi:flagellar secretion chaperone FliS
VSYDPTAAYRSAQVTTSSPASQVVLLYEGAIRFAAQSAMKLESRDLEAAHVASVRAQAIISALRESLDLSAGDVARQLDALYDYMHRRLVAGNVAKDPAPAREVITLLRDLLEAWRTVANPTPAPAAVPTMAPAPVRPAMGMPVAAMAGFPGGLRA